jgi:hypothetical protein
MPKNLKPWVGNLTGTTGSTNAIATSSGQVGVSAATAPTTGQVLTATNATTANWQGYSAAADALETTGSPVNVDNSPAPTGSGKILVAADATSATWQPGTEIGNVGRMVIKDDFECAWSTAETTAHIGYYWFRSGFSGGTIFSGTTTYLDKNHPGQWNIYSSSGDPTVSIKTAPFRLGGGSAEFTAIWRLPTLPTGGNDFRIRFGLADDNNTATSNGAYFEVWRATATANSITADNLLCSTADGTSEQHTNAGAITVGNWYKTRILINAALSSVEFYVNEVLVSTHTTVVPLSTLDVHIWASNNFIAGAAQRDFMLDYIEFDYQLTTSR